MSILNKIKNLPIDLLFVSNYYDKILFTHPKRVKLISLFITHVLLLIFYFVAPLIYDNKYFNIFYVCIIISMVCGWILLNGECWINLWEKKILNSNYKMGDNLDVNPGIDLLTKNTFFPIYWYFKKDIKYLINEEHYTYCKNVRYKIPLITPLVALVLFLWIRFKYVSFKYRLLVIFIFIILLITTHFRWKQIDKFYK